MSTFSPEYNKDTSAQQWRALHIFNLYRLVIVGVIAVTFFFAKNETVFGQKMPQIFGAVIIAWVSIVFISGFASRFKKPGFHWQVYTFIISDIAFIVLLMYASGGITSGLGTLLLITIAASGILLSSRMSFAFAAMATLAVFSIQGYLILTGREPPISVYSQNGLLGAGLFSIALLSHMLAQRIGASEALAEQRKAELLDLSDANELIIQQMKTGIILVDTSYTVQLMNRAAQDMISKQQNKTNCPLKSLSPKLYSQLLAWQESPQFSTEPFRSNQEAIEILPHFKRLEGRSGLTSLIFLDDTSLLSHQAQQTRLASLGHLTASIAHEIRNPLSAINHAGQLLDESCTLPEEDRRLIEIIQQQSERLNTIVKNILSLSKKEKFVQSKIDISNWIKKFHSSLISEQQIRPDQVDTLLPDTPQIIYFDSTHLGQIFCNLSDNAIRHSKKSESHKLLDIICHVDSKNDFITIDIIDYGEGIPKQNREKIFEPFYTTESTGTGLGLFISRELCQLNQAHLQYIENSDIENPHFRLTIPTDHKE